jgi:heat shock protein HslJ
LYVNQVPLPGTLMSVWFGAGGNASVNGGCNAYNGSYTASGSSLSFGPMAGTQKSCGADIDTQEQTYLSALAATSTYAISGSQLIMYDASAQEVARFNFAG